MTTTIKDAADQLDVTEETIVTLAGLFSDDPDLYDGEAITDLGMDVIRSQVTGSATAETFLADVAEATEVRNRALAVTAEATEAWHTKIRAAVAHGCVRTEVADRAGIHRSRLYQVLNGV
jgi:hypothetical protein